jgi:hypothetical protein
VHNAPCFIILLSPTSDNVTCQEKNLAKTTCDVLFSTAPAHISQASQINSQLNSLYPALCQNRYENLIYSPRVPWVWLPARNTICMQGSFLNPTTVSSQATSNNISLISSKLVRIIIQLFQLRLSPEQSGKVEYERERLLGIANKWMNLLAIPSRLSRAHSTFPLCSGDNLNWNSCIHVTSVL